MMEGGGRIPLTYHAQSYTGEPIWYLVLSDQLPEASVMSPGTIHPDSAFVCPTIDSRHHNLWYINGRIGYAVATRWKAAEPAGSNEWRRWDSVASPSSYPFFADPHVYEQVGTSTAFQRMGHNEVLSYSPAWGLGLVHHGNKSNAVFADGHVSVSGTDDLLELDASGTPRFFLADQ